MSALVPAKNILLTGAGFSKNFGGFLASEMWASLLNEVNRVPHPALREVMFEDDKFDYEAIYGRVLTSKSLTKDEKQAFTDSLRQAYAEMNRIICDYSQRAARCAVFANLISWFAGRPDSDDLGFLFTLNQDLLVEAFYRPQPGENCIRIPGLQNEKWFTGRLLTETPDEVTLPGTTDGIEKDLWKGGARFAYIKLHGSIGWRSAPGSDALVIGHAKAAHIQREPLLRWYFRLFREVLNAGDRNLIVIGYGFGDEHINEVILGAIHRNGLKLFIVAPSDPRDFGPKLLATSHAKEIWRSLQGYYVRRVTELYEPQQSHPTRIGKAFLRDLGVPPWRHS